MTRILVTLFVVATFSSSVAPAVRGEVPGLEWSSPVLIGPGTLSDGRSPSVLYTPEWVAGFPDTWHLVYVLDDVVRYRYEVSPGVWSTPTNVGSGSGAVHPRLAFAAGRLIVVWQDSRTGSPEIYGRVFTSEFWLGETLLSYGAGPASSPAVTGNEDGGLVMWESSAAIEARYFHGTGWGAEESVTAGTSPTVATTSGHVEFPKPFEAAWLESGQLHRGSRAAGVAGSWFDYGMWVAASCSAPSIAAEICCGDVIDSVPSVVFQKSVGGVTEVWGAGSGAEVLSPDDDVPSRNPQVAAAPFISTDCVWGGSNAPRAFVTWTDSTSPKTAGVADAYMMQYQFAQSGDGGLADRSVVAVTAGEPYRTVLQVTESGGVLSARRGTLPGCSTQSFVLSPALVVGPAGRPTNTVQSVNACGGLPLMTWWSSSINFGAAASGLTWSIDQDRPVVLLDFEAPDATAEVGIRAGGCVEGSPVEVGGSCLWIPNGVWPGVKSPDVNGDCVVAQDDRDYVSSHLGTGDFCADLDGSGLVDEFDLAIVDLTMGDECLLDPSAVDESLPPTAAVLRVQPNPGPGPFTVLLGHPEARSVAIKVFDSEGATRS